MRKISLVILSLATTLLWLPSSANAQRYSAEQSARATWSPVRTQQPRRKTSIEAKQVKSKPVVRKASAQSQAQANHVHQAGHSVPVPSSSVTVLEGPVIDTVPMDGHIVMDGHVPMHDGGCDSMSCEPGCGCGVATGGCDGLGRCSTDGCSMCGELASPNAWRPCLTIGLPQDGWVSYEYLSWWQDGMPLPPLVTTSPVGTTRPEAGVLGAPGTSILFGGEDVLEDRMNGGRLRFGFWLDRCHTWGLAGEFFRLGDESESFSATSTGTPILARPFFNTQTGLEDSELVAFPGVLTGTVSAVATSELRGAGFHFKRLRCCEEGCKSWLFCGCPDHFCSRTERLIGYRFLQLDESVQINENLVSTSSNDPGSFDIYDRFETRNQFNGVDVGWKYRMTRGYWVYSAMLRMAVGNTRQTVTIDGQTITNDPGATPTETTEAGGLLALNSNIGTYKQNEFSIIPELNLDLGYQLTDRIKLTGGYTFIYWSNVVRPGHIIDLDVNTAGLPPEQVPFTGVRRPAFQFDTTDYWVQGLNFGLEYRW